MRIAIYGAGDVVARAYLPEFARHSDLEVVGLCSAHGTSARKLGEVFDVPAFEVDELIERTRPDAVLVATPTVTHFELARRALEAGLHVIVEKPLCENFERSRQLIELARRSKGVLYPAYNNQFREENRKLKAASLEANQELKIIDLEWLRIQHSFPEHRRWFLDPGRSGGGVFMDLGTHLVHFALQMLMGRRKFKLIGSQVPETSTSVDDAAMCTLTIDDSVLVSIRTAWHLAMHSRARVTFRVFGDRTSASNHDFEPVQKDNGYAYLIRDFREMVESQRQGDLDLTLDTMQVVDAFYRSARTGGSCEETFASRCT